MNAKQISRVKHDYRYFEARNRCELPGTPADIDSCRHQAYRLWAQLAPQLRGSGAEPDFVIESDFVDTIANELYADIMNDYNDREQRKAVEDIQQSSDRLYGRLHRTEIPEDFTDKVPNCIAAYRQFAVTDIAKDIETAFLLCRERIVDSPFHARKGLFRVDVFLVDTGDNYNMSIAYERVADVLNMAWQAEISRPSAVKLANHIKKETRCEEFPEIIISFRRLGV